jgi:hypothetical protein
MTLLVATLGGATAVVGAITAFMVQVNKTRTLNRKNQENARDSDEFRKEEIHRREREDVEVKQALWKRLDEQEKEIEGLKEELDDVLKRLKNLNKLL